MRAGGEMGRHTVLLVEDNDPTRARLEQAIDSHAELELVGSCPDCASARRVLSEQPPDVLLTDLELPDGNGMELIRELRSASEDSLSMVITVFADEKTVVSAVEAGASGYLLKGASNEDVGASILQLLAGGSPISAPIARYLLRRFQRQPAAAPEGPSEAAPDLTDREHEILTLIAKGFSFPEIGDILEISPHTVTTHVRHIYRKLEVGSRSAAVYEAVHLGIIKMED
jgi:DNA-binding NarL/FixJ family response regulator